MKPWVALGLILLLTACGTPETSTPLPTPQVINLVYPPALQPWADQLSDCATNNPTVALFLIPTIGPAANIQSNDILLELGDTSPSGSTYFSQVGREQITVIVSQENAISNLSTGELRSIFSGKTSTWQAGTEQPIQVWVLPQADPTRQLFEQVVMQNSPLTTQAMLAPDPAAMLEAISSNANSIGFIPGSYLNASGTVDPGTVNIIQLDSSLASQLNQPVVAITQREPAGNLRNLLICLEANHP